MTFDTAKVLAATTPEDRAKEAATFADSLKVADLAKLQGASVDAFRAVLGDKAKGNADKRAGVMAILRAISVAFGKKAESVLVPLLPDAIEALADKLKPVSNEADKFIEALSSNLSTHAVKVRWSACTACLSPLPVLAGRPHPCTHRASASGRACPPLPPRPLLSLAPYASLPQAHP